MSETVRANAVTGSARLESTEGFPPQTTRQSELDAITEFYRGVIGSRRAVYVSAPITSGRRLIDWLAKNGNRTDTTTDSYRDEHRVAVIQPNREVVKKTVDDIRDRFQQPIIDPTAVGDISGWDQGDYRTAWARLIDEFVEKIVFVDGWEFSNGCCFEFWVGQRQQITTLDAKMTPLSLDTGVEMIGKAVSELKQQGLDATFMRAVLRELRALVAQDERAQPLQSHAQFAYKDEVLDQLATQGNVAQFVSFDPNLKIRFSRIRSCPPNAKFESVEDALTALLVASPECAINIRSYEPNNPKSREFIYGVKTVAAAMENLTRLSRQGLFTIANETIDVNDGGVSGVALGDLLEFAPDDTPRAVEKAGICRLPREIGLGILKRVYDFVPALPAEVWRTEFSIHPSARGFHSAKTILWEMEPAFTSTVGSIGAWPNRFSQFIGDKVFGLLVADALGFPVPHTSVFARRIAPFTFGRRTGTGETWIRTCPREPVPGKFTTHRGWLDPFSLLRREDPDETQIVSVLAQEGIDVRFAGAAMSGISGEPVIEGVKGAGDSFMVGAISPQKLPGTVSGVVAETVRNVESTLASPAKIEWAFDGERVWIVQLHRSEAAVSDTVIVPGIAKNYRRFDVSSGLEALREVIREAVANGEGIVLQGSVGVTSHFGDVLRKAKVPSRIA